MSRSAAGFLVGLAIALALTAVLAPLLGWLLPDMQFHRVLTRVFLGAVLLVFLARAGPPRAWASRLRAMGLDGPDRLRRVLLGATVAVALIGLLLVVSWALGGRTVRTGAATESLLVKLAGAAGTGIAVALLEEVLCRGYLKDAIGGVASAALYAGAHYFRPLHGSAPAGAEYDPLLVLERASSMLEAWTVPRNATLGFLSLFLLGLALNRLRDRTGTLYLGIGVHAGLVFAVEAYRRLLDPIPARSAWIFGGPRLHDGLLGTLAIALLCLAVARLPLPGTSFPARRNTSAG